LFRSIISIIGLITLLAAIAGAQDQTGRFVYPCELIDTYTPLCACWTGLDETGDYGQHIRVVPETWLVGPPPSDLSAVTVVTDHWVELRLPGPLADGPDSDLLITEMGQRGESSLIFLTDGQDRAYPLGIAQAYNLGSQGETVCYFDVGGITPGFSPMAVRVVSLGLGGGSPGFDVGSIRAYVRVDTSRPHLPAPAQGVTQAPAFTALTWSPGGARQESRLYLGPNPASVDPALAHPRTILPADVNSYQPNPPLTLGSTYYWRIVERTGPDPNTLRVGDIWRFSLAPTMVIHDFEAYQSESELSREWRFNGLTPVIASCNEGPHGGCQAIQLNYFSYLNPDSYFSYRFHTPQDWLGTGAGYIEIFFKGVPGNASTHRLYLGVGDGQNEQVIKFPGDTRRLQEPAWHRWAVPLDDFSGVDLGQVASLTIGIDQSDIDVMTYQSGTLFIDDLRLCSDYCSPEQTDSADFNKDCRHDYMDLSLLADTWLQSETQTLPVTEPNAPVTHLTFDKHIDDVTGLMRTQGYGELAYQPGRLGYALSIYVDSLNSLQGIVEFTNPQDLVSHLDTGITIAFWEFTTDGPHHMNTILCSDFKYGTREPELAISLGLWKKPGQLQWICGSPWTPDNWLRAPHRSDTEWTHHWNHWAFTKDFRTGQMSVYLNGHLHSAGLGAASGLADISTLTLGSGWYSYYNGLLDDLRIYGYALKTREVAYVATQGTGRLDVPLTLPTDLNADRRIDLKDFALLAEAWLYGNGWE